MQALVRECKNRQIFSIVSSSILPPMEKESPENMIQRVERWMDIEDINPHIKTLGGGHQIINFQSLHCGMDTTTNVSDPNTIRLARHLIIRRKRFAMNMQKDDERMWADYFLHKTLSTGIEGTQTILVATVARAIQIVDMEKEA